MEMNFTLSSDKKSMELGKATELANKVLNKLKVYCDQALIAGSIRRECEKVGDIEIVARPKTIENDHLFFEGVKLKAHQPLYGYLDKLETQKKIRQIKKGHKYRKFLLLSGKEKPIISVDLFLIHHLNEFGTQLLIRTGPRSFSKWIVNVRKNKGFLFEKKRLLQNGKEIDTSSEAKVFKALNIPYIYPNKRVGPVILDK